MDRRLRSAGRLDRAWQRGKALAEQARAPSPPPPTPVMPDGSSANWLAPAVSDPTPAVSEVAQELWTPTESAPVAPSAETRSRWIVSEPAAEDRAISEPRMTTPTSAERWLAVPEPQAQPEPLPLPALPASEPSAAVSRWLAANFLPAVPGTVTPAAVASATDNGAMDDGATDADEASDEEPIDPDQARQAVVRYCLEMGLTAPLDDLFGRVLEREERRPEFSANAKERLLAGTGWVVADALAVRPAVHAGWRQVLGAEHQDDCHQTLRRRALAADGQLDGHDQNALSRHLESCLPCRALEIRAARAERAFGATFLLGAGVAATVAASPAPTAAAVTPPPPLPTPDPGQQRRRRPAGLFAGAAAVLGGGAIAVALLSGGSHRPLTRNVPASGPVAAISTSTRSAAPALTAPRPLKEQHRAHHRGAKTHPKVASVTSTSSVVTAAPTNATPSTPVVPAPATVVTPASPPPTQPASSGSISASQQGGNLPAQSAPTQTIGSLGSPPPKH